MKSILTFIMVTVSLFGASLPAASIDGDREISSGSNQQQNQDFSSTFITTTWNTGEGLPVNDIQDLQETPDGYLWIGTYQGLIRFDGVQFQTFLKTPIGARYGARVAPLELDQGGRLWLAPDQVGVLRLDGDNFTEVLTNGAVIKARVNSLCSDGTDRMMWVDGAGHVGWFSTEQPYKAERLGNRVGPSARWLRDFQKSLWLVSPRTVRLHSDGKLKNLVVPGEGSMLATPRRSGGLWIARDAKLQWIDANGKATEVATFPWKGQSRVTSLLEDSQNRLWIGTLGPGLFCFADGKFVGVATGGSSVSCLLEDRAGNLWAGTRGGGLVRIRARKFFVVDTKHGLKHEFIRSLAQDKEGRLWMLPGDGSLGWMKGNAWHSLGADMWPGYDSLSVTPAVDEGVWVSTTRRGVWRFKEGKWTRQHFKPKPLPEPPVDLLHDSGGRLWMVTDNSGIFCFDGTNVSSFSRGVLPSDHMRQIIEAEPGDLWAGDWEGGIARFQNNRWQIVRKRSGHMDAVRSMVVIDGALWIGTSAGGLLRLKNGKTSRIGTEQGLPDACIQQLLPDGHGWLWGATPHKLFRLSLDKLNVVADGREENIDAIVYGRSDGLPETSFANWNDPRSWRASDGELWFATANGAIHVQPAHLRTSTPPKIFIEATLLDGKPVGPTTLQNLRPGPGRLEFRFTAPSLTAPERIRFRYRLTGVDADWVDAGTTRSATYASIPAGQHSFRVIASSPDGVWSEQPATVSLSVHPFFWQTTWFLTSIAAVTAGGTAWTVRRAAVKRLRRRVERLRQESAVDRERARIAQDIHDELGANLTSIGLLADMGSRNKSDPTAVARELQEISATARETVAAMDAIVWALNPRNDSLDHFANYITQFTRDFFRPTNVRTRLDVPTNLPAQPLPMETRHQLFLIVKESFNNIARHAEATEVKLDLHCEDGHLRLVIADNGKGLSKKTQLEKGNGLDNLRRRIERLGGRLHIESEAGQGTRLSFILPIAHSRVN